MEKIAINTWAFDPRLTLYERFKVSESHGIKTLEVNFEENVQHPMLTWSTNSTDLQETKRFLSGENYSISSICTELFWTYNLASADSSEKNKAMSMAKKMIDFAYFLNADSILIVPGIIKDKEKREGNYAELLKVCRSSALQSIHELAIYAKESGIILGLENVFFNNFLIDAIDMKEFISDLNAPNVKVHFDVGNAQINDSVEDWILILKDLIYAIHVKDTIMFRNSFVQFCPPLYGDVNWEVVFSALKTIKFNRYLIGEQSFAAIGNEEKLIYLISALKIINNHNGRG